MNQKIKTKGLIFQIWGIKLKKKGKVKLLNNVPLFCSVYDSTLSKFKPALRFGAPVRFRGSPPLR